MENLRSEKVERIMDLVEWFEEYQPNDLKQIERIILGLRYVDNEVVESQLRQDMYTKIKFIESEKFLELSDSFIDAFFRKDLNERMMNK